MAEALIQGTTFADQMIRRIGTNGDADQTTVRAFSMVQWHYLTRYLSVPRLASRETTARSSMTFPRMKIRAALLDAFDRQRQVDLAAGLFAPGSS